VSGSSSRGPHVWATGKRPAPVVWMKSTEIFSTQIVSAPVIKCSNFLRDTLSWLRTYFWKYLKALAEDGVDGDACSSSLILFGVGNIAGK